MVSSQKTLSLSAGRETSSVTISFRLDESSAEALLTRAKRLGVSQHELARHYVLELLQEGEERAALWEAISTLHASSEQMRQQLFIATEVLLSSAGKVSPNDAATWIKETFKDQCSQSQSA